ncbi:ImmA/IrrE family metallo-endopeptidase [Helicobacter cholecystus]|uniref:ImmA/IrrE family metallo-endopeptidase n=1 Tax=Helicobacter cholecystus TaxID=45498 RepID=A0A3D8IXW3_9HELI|nr:ImmA/IrrE family metallo-endopeptidase [Helicobacter cholecystus]RDU70102.1 ImmA/IrrE family metallo-endopeptidase [Helicobacter cholecystus]VEJ24720.1 Domain of uncharacterised function (DUF955) [Helicobacter cholecystus]
MNIEELKSILLGKSAEEILDILKINNAPVDIKTILREKLNITISEKMEWDKLALDGSVYLKNGYPEIWLNTSFSENRQNFTLAHELGHIVNDILPNLDQENMSINDDYNTLYRSESEDPRESRANSFAAKFLMPLRLIAQEAKRLTETPEFKNLNLQQVIQRMADRFRVSYDAMKWRLVNLKYIDKSKL